MHNSPPAFGAAAPEPFLRRNWPALRRACYVFGVLAALPFALLCLLIPGGSGFGLLLTTGAWLGMAGLVWTLFIEPEEAGGLANLFAFCLLLAGELAFLPLSMGLLLGAMPAGLSALLVWPPLVGLHYMVRILLAMRESGDVFALRLLAGLGVVIAGGGPLYWVTRDQPAAQVISATRPAAEITVLREGPARFAEVTVAPLLAAGYRSVHADGRTYQALPRGARRSVPWAGEPSRYVVIERISLIPDSEPAAWRSDVEVLDQAEDLRLGNRQAWVGDGRPVIGQAPDGYPELRDAPAASFLQRVLVPPPRINLPWGYPETPLNLHELQPATLVDPALFGGRPAGCGAVSVRPSPAGYNNELAGQGWWYQPDSAIRQVACLGDSYLLLSDWHLGGISLDHVDRYGQLLGQYRLDLKATDGSREAGQVALLSADSRGGRLYLRFGTLSWEHLNARATRYDRELAVDFTLGSRPLY